MVLRRASQRRIPRLMLAVILGLTLLPTLVVIFFHVSHLSSSNQWLLSVPLTAFGDGAIWAQALLWGGFYPSVFTFILSVPFVRLTQDRSFFFLALGLLIAAFASDIFKISAAAQFSPNEEDFWAICLTIGQTLSQCVLASFAMCVTWLRVSRLLMILLPIAWVALISLLVSVVLNNHTAFLAVDALRPGLLVVRPLATISFVAVGLVAFHVLRPLDRKYRSAFTQALLYSAIPHGLAQLHLIFGSEHSMDSHALASHLLETIGFCIPFIGLTLDLARALRDRTNSLEEVESERTTLRTEIDIHRQTEEALRRSEKKYRDLVETSNDLIWAVDGEGRWTFLNRAACVRILGYEPEELIGKSFTAIKPEEFVERDLEVFRSVINGVPHFAYETDLIRKDGRRISLSFNAIAMRDDEGNVVGTTGTAADVTERRLAEVALTQQTRFFRQVIDMNPNLIFAKDRNGRFTLVNKSVADIYGAPAEEIIGKTDADFNPKAAEVEHFRTDDEAVLQDAQPLFVPEEIITDHAGKRRVLQTVKLPLFDEFGNADQVLGVATDITDRKRNEEQTRAILETAVDVIVTIARDGTINSANTAAERLFSYRPSELIGKNICHLVASPYAFELQYIFEETNIRGRHPGGIGREMKGKRRDGTIFPIEVSVSALNESTQMYTAIIRDITIRKRAEDSLRENERQLRRQNAVLLELAKNKALGSGLIHEALREITEVASRTLDVDRVGVWQLSEDESELRCLDQYERLADQHFNEESLPASRYQHYFRAIREERALLAHDALSDPRTAELVKDYLLPRGVTSMIDAPVRIGSRMVAIICHEHTGPRRQWTLEEQNFAGSMADLVALTFEAYERKRAQDALQQKAAFEKLITQISTRFIDLPPDSVDDGLTEALRLIGEFTGVDRGYLLVTDVGRNTIVNTHEWCRSGIPSHRQQLNLISIPQFRFILDKVERLEAIHLRNPAELPSTAVAEQEYFEREGIKTLVCVPLVYAGRSVGILGFDSVRSETQWPDEFISLLHIVADIFISAIERRKADEHIREHAALLDITQDGIIVVDTNDRITFWNTTAESIFALTPEDVLGRQLGDVLCTEPAFGSEEVRQNLRLHGKWRGEMQLSARQGRSMTIESRCSAITDSDGRAKSVLVVVTDITDRKKWESESVRASKLESIGILAGGIAHDFNNILTAIVGNISLMKMDATPNDASYIKLERIERATQRARELTQQLLTFAKGGSPIKKTNSFSEIIHETAEFSLRGSSCRPDFQLPSDLWPIEADAGQISQVINNLLINAVQASKNGGVIRFSGQNITLSAPGALPGSKLPQGRYVKVSIQDEGCGIPPEILDKIFDPFFTTKESGTGLGLATSYSIVKQHQGHISVESQVNGGTTFHLYLPASDKLPETREQREEVVSPGSGKVLFMDDEEIVREIAANMLRRLGYQPESATDGEQAIEMYQRAMHSESPYVAVIMDLTVAGGMGGAAAIQRLRAIDSQIRAIVTSGYSGDRIMSNCHEFGFDGVLVKPFQLKDLGDILHSVIAQDDNSSAHKETPDGVPESTASRV